jgi:hypothetical protein
MNSIQNIDKKDEKNDSRSGKVIKKPLSQGEKAAADKTPAGGPN